jgi:two-component system nitrogen regulation response regulator GlnG
MVKEGAFRHDLYFRLGAFRIEIPPLRDRREDIGELAVHFLSQMHKSATPAPALSEQALEELESRPWYGNVRELRNAIEHAVIVARGGVIEPEHLPQPASEMLPDEVGATPPVADSIAALVQQWAEDRLQSEKDSDDLHEQLLRMVETPLFQAAIDRYHGQCAAAARRLGMHRTTLRKKLDQYDISENQASPEGR